MVDVEAFPFSEFCVDGDKVWGSFKFFAQEDMDNADNLEDESCEELPSWGGGDLESSTSEALLEGGTVESTVLFSILQVKQTNQKGPKS